MRRSIRKFNIPPPGQPPGHLNFWRLACPNTPPRGKKAVQMPHQLLLKYLSSKTNFVFNQTLYTLFREIHVCRNDTFKHLLKTLLKELFTNKGNFCLVNPSNPAKTEKTHGRITSEQEINPVQIPHPSNATFKFPPPRARCTVKSPGYARGGGGMLKFRIDRCINLRFWIRLKLRYLDS